MITKKQLDIASEAAKVFCETLKQNGIIPMTTSIFVTDIRDCELPVKYQEFSSLSYRASITVSGITFWSTHDFINKDNDPVKREAERLNAIEAKKTIHNGEVLEPETVGA